MFSRAKRVAKTRELVLPQEARPTLARPTPPSIISSDLYIKGDLVTEGDVHIDGRVDGDIRARIVTIGEGGRVQGAIACEELVVYGALCGRAEAVRIFLMGSARVVADIVHDLLQIEEGAAFEGSCRRQLAAGRNEPEVAKSLIDPFAA